MRRIVLLLTLTSVATAVGPSGGGTSTGSQSWQQVPSASNNMNTASKARIVDILAQVPSCITFDEYDDQHAEDLVSSGEAEFGLRSKGLEASSLSRQMNSIDGGGLQLLLSPTTDGETILDLQTRKHPFLTGRVPKAKLRSTGTTIAGCVCDGNIVVLGADTRATADRIVADKRAEKIHELAPGIYACGAGTSADLEHTTRLCRYSLELNRRQSMTGNSSHDDDDPIITISATVRFLKEHLMKGGGNIGANLIVGGQGTIVAIHPHGSIDVVPYTALGSGGLAAMAVLEEGFRKDLSLDGAKELVIRAVQAGIRNDLGSGSQVDLCILYPTGETIYRRGIVQEEGVVDNRAVGSGIPDEAQKQDEGATSGVNGFGTIPFTVLSRRVRMQSSEESDEVWKRIMLDS